MKNREHPSRRKIIDIYLRYITYRSQNVAAINIVAD
jgi:hypothetical protein